MKLSPIEMVFPLPKFISAITLFPLIVYSNKNVKNDKCIRQHELYHWQQALKYGVIPWYLCYLILLIFYFNKPANEHPLEKEAYAIQWKCEG